MPKTQKTKLALAFPFTGLTMEELGKTAGRLKTTLLSLGFDVYCSLDDEAKFQKQKLTQGQMVRATIEEFLECDALVAFVPTSYRSEGLLMEVGVAIGADMPMTLIRHDSAHTVLSEIVQSVVGYSDFEYMLERIRREDIAVPEES